MTPDLKDWPMVFNWNCFLDLQNFVSRQTLLLNMMLLPTTKEFTL